MASNVCIWTGCKYITCSKVFDHWPRVPWKEAVALCGAVNEQALGCQEPAPEAAAVASTAVLLTALAPSGP